jgi:hypothetical protein
MTSPAASPVPTATVGSTGSYVVRVAPWSTTTTPRPTSTPGHAVDNTGLRRPVDADADAVFSQRRVAHSRFDTTRADG